MTNKQQQTKNRNLDMLEKLGNLDTLCQELLKAGTNIDIDAPTCLHTVKSLVNDMQLYMYMYYDIDGELDGFYDKFQSTF